MQGNGPERSPLPLQIGSGGRFSLRTLPRKGRRSSLPSGTSRRRRRAAPCRFSPTRSSAGPTIDGRDYLVRQLNDHKASVNIADLKSAALLEYAAVCGELLARSHARAGDSGILSGYIGTSGRFDTAILTFAEGSTPTRPNSTGSNSSVPSKPHPPNKRSPQKFRIP